MTGRRPAPLERLAAAGLIVCSAVSTQGGAAFAVRLFPLAGPMLAALIRNLVGTAILAAILLARGHRLRGVNLPQAALLGVVLGTMNATFYEAIFRLPLGDAVSVEFIGPIAVAVLFSQQRRELLWIAMAAAGIVAIAHPGPQHLSYAGLGFVLAAAACWATYLVLARRVAVGPRRMDTLAVAMGFSTLWLLLPALLESAPSLLDARVLGLGAGIGLASSAIPYSIELIAMGKVSATIYGVLLSLQPLVAAIAGFVILAQRFSALEAVGFALVIAASVGVTLTAKSPEVMSDTAAA